MRSGSGVVTIHEAGQHVGLKCVVPQKNTTKKLITGQTRNRPIFAMRMTRMC